MMKMDEVTFDISAMPRVISAGFYKAPSTLISPRHGQDCHEIDYISSGQAQWNLNGVPFHYGAGSVYSFQPGDLTGGKVDPAHGMFHSRFVKFNWPARSGKKHGRSVLALPRTVRLRTGTMPIFQALFDRLIECYMEGWAGWEMVASGYLLAMMGLLVKEARTSPNIDGALDRRVALGLNFFERNIAKPFKIGEAAKAARLSENYFCRCFRKTMGFSPMQYVVQLRLQEARVLLIKQSALSITEVGQLVGFGNPKYFATAFRAHFGVTPSDFRKSTLAPWRSRLQAPRQAAQDLVAD